ncbi:hypothetical protein C8A00DRAFT_13152 [Chaetomidium leptoderma]|uniref:Uncharacterized protein n=1 Tax=Chaetomidium leptoderma TaxID=669021 RepID=A0AAN6ZYT7_9PEZI|nr:hypothetical protein C8A00DRAFT_13152 [Chaetomidium leptoderma]
MPGNLPEQYRKAMRAHRLGYALYQPDLYTRLHPGILGYLDDDRTWHPLLDLTQTPISNLTQGGTPVPEHKYTPFSPPVPKDPDARFWGPKVSSKSTETTLSLASSADALALGLPLEVGGAVEYQSKADFGAVLLCDDAVVADGFDVRDPSLAWLKRNSAALLADFPDLKRHGVCVATWTYSATSVHINAWEGTGRKVVLGFKVGAAAAAAGVGNAGSSQMAWSRVEGSSGWAHFVDGEKRVVFFSGVKVNYGVFGPRGQAEKRWRGAKSDKFLVHRMLGGDDDESCVAEVEIFGDDYDEVK